jgi:hypothetical protein
LLPVAAHVASRFFVHRMLLLIAAASRARHRRGQMRRYVRGAPPGDQPMATRFCAEAEANLWYVIPGRPFTPEYADSADPDVRATHSQSTVSISGVLLATCNRVELYS